MHSKAEKTGPDSARKLVFQADVSDGRRIEAFIGVRGATNGKVTCENIEVTLTETRGEGRQEVAIPLGELLEIGKALNGSAK